MLIITFFFDITTHLKTSHYQVLTLIKSHQCSKIKEHINHKHETRILKEFGQSFNND